MVHATSMIDRMTGVKWVRAALKRSRVVALLGPRQCGKTTLARQFVPVDLLNYFDLEDLLSLAATYNGAELDLLLFKRGRRIGVECKRADAPSLNPSMRIAVADLKLDELHVVYPGEKRYTLTKKVHVVPLAQFVNAK